MNNRQSPDHSNEHSKTIYTQLLKYAKTPIYFDCNYTEFTPETIGPMLTVLNDSQYTEILNQAKQGFEIVYHDNSEFAIDDRYESEQGYNKQLISSLTTCKHFVGTGLNPKTQQVSSLEEKKPVIEQPSAFDKLIAENVEIEELFLDPITLTLMQEPYLVIQMHTFDHVSLEKWLKKSKTNPLTGLVLTNNDIYPNLLAMDFLKDPWQGFKDPITNELIADPVWFPIKGKSAISIDRSSWENNRNATINYYRDEFDVEISNQNPISNHLMREVFIAIRKMPDHSNYQQPSANHSSQKLSTSFVNLQKKATLLFNNGEFRAARDLLLENSETSKLSTVDQFDFHCLLGSMHHAMSDFKNEGIEFTLALQAFEKITDPIEKKRAQLHLAMVHTRLGDAHRISLARTAGDTDNAKEHYVKAVRHYELGAQLSAEALQAFPDLIESNPHLYWQIQGDILTCTENIIWTTKKLQGLFKKETSEYKTLTNKVSINEEQQKKDVDSMVKAYEEKETKTDQNPFAYYMQGKMYFLLKKFSASMDSCGKAYNIVLGNDKFINKEIASLICNQFAIAALGLLATEKSPSQTNPIQEDQTLKDYFADNKSLYHKHHDNLLGARQKVERGLKINPYDRALRKTSVKLRMHLGEFYEAAQSCEKTYDPNESYPDIEMMLLHVSALLSYAKAMQPNAPRRTNALNKVALIKDRLASVKITDFKYTKKAKQYWTDFDSLQKEEIADSREKAKRHDTPPSSSSAPNNNAASTNSSTAADDSSHSQLPPPLPLNLKASDEKNINSEEEKKPAQENAADSKSSFQPLPAEIEQHNQSSNEEELFAQFKEQKKLSDALSEISTDFKNLQNKAKERASASCFQFFFSPRHFYTSAELKKISDLKKTLVTTLASIANLLEGPLSKEDAARDLTKLVNRMSSLINFHRGINVGQKTSTAKKIDKMLTH